jgi:hypothetical protein
LTDAGGWFDLNSKRMPVHDVLRRKLNLKRQKAFCKKLMQQQIDAGGRVLFEHPSPSCYWDVCIAGMSKIAVKLHQRLFDLLGINLFLDG